MDRVDQPPPETADHETGPRRSYTDEAFVNDEDLFNEFIDPDAYQATNNQSDFQNASLMPAGTQVQGTAPTLTSITPFFQQTSQPLQASPALRYYNTSDATPASGGLSASFSAGPRSHPPNAQFMQPMRFETRPSLGSLNQPSRFSPVRTGANLTRLTQVKTWAEGRAENELKNIIRLTPRLASNQYVHNALGDLPKPSMGNHPISNILSRESILLDTDPCKDPPKHVVFREVIVKKDGVNEGVFRSWRVPLTMSTRPYCSKSTDTKHTLGRIFEEEKYDLPAPKLDHLVSINGLTFTVFRGTGQARWHFAPAMMPATAEKFGTNIRYLRNCALKYPPKSKAREGFNAALLLEFHLTFGQANFQYQNAKYRDDFLKRYHSEIQEYPPPAVVKIQNRFQGLQELVLRNRIQLLLIDADNDQSDVHLEKLLNRTRSELCNLIVKGEPFVERMEGAYEEVKKFEDVLSNVKTLLAARVGFTQKTFLLTMAMVIWPLEEFKTKSVAMAAFLVMNKEYLSNVVTDEQA